MKTSYAIIIVALIFSVGFGLGSQKEDKAMSAKPQIAANPAAIANPAVIPNAAGFQMKNNSKSFASDSDYALVNFPGHTGYYAVYLPR